MSGMRNVLGTCFALTVLVTAPAAAQYAGEIGKDRFTIAGQGAVLIPAKDLVEDELDLDVGGGGGVILTYWPHRNVGLRASALLNAITFEQNAPLPSGADEGVLAWYVDGDVVLRLPLSLGADGKFWWFPYVVGGGGIRVYDFDETVSSESSTEFAGNFGAGVEFRFHRWGVFGEFRDFVSDFSPEDIETLPGGLQGETQHDLVVSAGVTFSF